VCGSAGLRPGGGGRKPPSPIKYLKRAVVRYAAFSALKTRGAALPSLLRTTLEKRKQKGKFWCGQNLPFRLKKHAKSTM